MKLIIILISFCINTVVAQDVIVQLTAKKHTKMPLLIITNTPDLEPVIKILSRDIMFSGQFTVTNTLKEKNPTKKQVSNLFKKGFPLALYLNKRKRSNTLEWRLYDTISGQMVQGKKCSYTSMRPNQTAHHIADTVWPTLTSHNGFFSTKIAYCKSIQNAQSCAPIKQLFISDFDGTNAQQLVQSSQGIMAPSWSTDKNNPLVFYSEHTPINVCLMSIDIKKQKRTVSDFPGINMSPTFSADGKSVVYCASKGNGGCQLYYCNKGSIKQITDNTGNNFSPSFASNNTTIYYCSDYNAKIPQIYSYNIVTDCTNQITHSAYCACPDYCVQKNQLVYTRMVKGIMQIFIYDIDSNKHYQLTYDAVQKEECLWSPCGNYILFCSGNHLAKKLVILNILTQEYKIITSENEFCSGPAWSPFYCSFPVFA